MDDIKNQHPSNKLSCDGWKSSTQNFARPSIALISDHGDPAAEIGVEEAGGQNVYVRQVGETLAALGWQVDMFTRKVRPDDPAIVQHSPYCRTIRLVAGPEQFIPRDEIFDYMPQFVEAFEAFRLREGTSYLLVHTNYWLSAAVGLRLRELSQIPLVHTYHSIGTVKYRAVPHRPAIAVTRERVERQILEQANCVVATSPQEQESLRALVSQKGNIEVIPYGTDIDNFHTIPKAEARAKLGLDPTKQIVLYVGRFDPRKGIETMVRACAQSKAQTGGNLQVVIAGGSCPDRVDGRERKRIESIVQAVGLTERTLFPGRLDHSVLPLYYAAADVCVVPSHYEPFGLVTIEAMACGTPVVASDVGGLKFAVVSGQTGLLVPPNDTTAFAAAIDQVLADKSWAKQLGLNARVHVHRHFSLTKIVAQLNNLYLRLLMESKGYRVPRSFPLTVDILAHSGILRREWQGVYPQIFNI